MKMELRGRCKTCKNERTITGFETENPTPDFMDRVEASADRRGSWDCNCPVCGKVEDVSIFLNGEQVEPWMNADDFEKLNGPSAGPLPPKPW